jgi:hypothetical protein
MKAPPGTKRTFLLTNLHTELVRTQER